MRQTIKLTPQEATAIGAAFRGWSLESRNVEQKRRRATLLREKADALQAEARGEQAAADEVRSSVVKTFLQPKFFELGAADVVDAKIDGDVFTFEDRRTEEQFAAFLAEKQKLESEAAKKKAAEDAEKK